MESATKTLFTEKWATDLASIQFAIHTCCVLVLQLNQPSQFRYGHAGLHKAGVGRSCCSHSISVHGDTLLIAATCFYRGTPCITTSEWGPLFYSAGSSLFAQKTAVLWDQNLMSLHSQQKISFAVAYCSFETGLMTVWNGMLGKQSTNGAQKRNSALTVLPSVCSLAILSCRH